MSISRTVQRARRNVNSLDRAQHGLKPKLSASGARDVQEFRAVLRRKNRPRRICFSLASCLLSGPCFALMLSAANERRDRCNVMCANLFRDTRPCKPRALGHDDGIRTGPCNHSPAPVRCGTNPAYCCCCCCASLLSSSSCSARHMILPEPVLGSDSTNSTLRGTLYAAMFA